MTVRTTHLTNTIPPHNKEYNISIVEVAGAGGSSERLDVPFTFGPIGSASQGGKLNKKGLVDLVEANKLFDKKRMEQLRKGYAEVLTNGGPQVLSEVARERTEWLPQLCNDIDPRDLEKLLTSRLWALEQKYDGKRIQIVKGYGDEEVFGINRKGIKIGLPQEVVDRIRAIDGRVHLDGELVGSAYIAWDILRRQGREYTETTSLADRRTALTTLWRSYNDAFTLARHTVDNKAQMLEELRAENAEGGVFKLLSGGYKPGRPNSGGDWLRHKFWASASLRVLAPDPKGKRSVLLALYDGEAWKYAGKVTVSPNFDLPDKDAVVECRYLYARKASGSLYQPIYLGPRDDVGWSGCVTSQLKFKQGDEDDDETSE